MNGYIVSLTIWLIFYFSFPALPDVLVCSLWHNGVFVYKTLTYTKTGF